MSQPDPCPHPEKQRHRTRKAAEKARAAVERTSSVDPGLRPYKCGEHWHLGHRGAGSLETQLRRAVKLGRLRRPRRAG